MSKKDPVYLAHKDIEWMTRGTPCIFAPPDIPGNISGKPFNGRVGGDPFLMGNPKNNKWVVRVEDLDSRYQKIFGKTVYSVANVEHVFPRMED